MLYVLGLFCSCLQMIGLVSTELILHLKPNTARLIKEFLVFLWNLKVHYRVVRRKNHLNLFYTLITFFHYIHFNTVSHLYLSLLRGLFPSNCSKTSVLKVTYLSSFIDHHNIFWWIIQIVRLLIMQFPQVACYFLWQICSKYISSFWDISVWLQPVASRW